MEYTQLGRTKIKVSRLCIGTWQASGWATSDDSSFVDTVRHALSLGLNFIDTAEGYGAGHSEKLVAKAIKGMREKVVIATKFSHNNSRPAQIRKSLEDSLQRLGTDYIDLYQQHWPPKSPPLSETISELERLKGEGKIRAIGVSNWMKPEWDEIDDPARIDSLQPCYSLLWRTCEDFELPLCNKHGIAVIPYSPLCQGILTGRFKDLSQIPKDPRKQNVLLTPKHFPSVQKVIATIQEIAAKYNKTPGQVALRWLLDQDGVTAPIIGASSVKQANENIGVFGWSLASEDIQRLSEESCTFKNLFGAHDSLWNWHPRR